MLFGKWIQYIGTLLPVLIAFIAGYTNGSLYEKYKYNKVLLETTQAHVVELNDLGRRKDETINLLLQNADTFNSVKHSLDERINSLQFHFSSGNKELLQTTRRINAESIVTCRKLLAEGAGLLGEGVTLLQETNRRLDTAIKLSDTEKGIGRVAP